jgi:protein MAK16
MQNDDVIWQIINHQFCSFKSKIARERTFCQNPYNVTGLCIRSACPLANSRYATIREEEGDCYLYIKTIERAHTPKNLWEKIKLPSNYTKALELVSNELEHFPKYLVHRNKQRLTKIHQMLIRMRKLKLRASPKLVTTNTKIEQREKGKERKALAAAQLDRAIEKELLERLRQATEGEIFNYPERQYSRVLNKASNRFQTGKHSLCCPPLLSLIIIALGAL